MKVALAAAAAAILALALLAVGQWLSCLQSGFLGLTPAYLRSLAPEIGGSGIVAVFIGTVAAAALSLFQDARRQAAHRGRIEAFGRRGRPVLLGAETAAWSADLDFTGVPISGERIEDGAFARVRFAAGRNGAGAMTDMAFDACRFRRCSFGGGQPTFPLLDTVFTDCAITRCDFSGIRLEREHDAAVFSGGSLVRSRFDGARFVNARLNVDDVRGCTFWGASFSHSHLPTAVREELEALGAITVLASTPGCWGVISRREFYRRPTLARMAYGLRLALALGPRSRETGRTA